MNSNLLFSAFVNTSGQKSIQFFTDCTDTNATSRVSAHLVARTQHQVFIGPISFWQEGALNILNVLEVWADADSRGNIVVGNFSPRTETEWQNGAPFCFTLIDGNLVVANPKCFALLIESGLCSSGDIFQTDVKEVCSKFLSDIKAEEIASTQFRSLWYVARLIQWIIEDKGIPCKPLNTKKHVPKVSKSTIFLIDNFANIKLSISAEVLESLIGTNSMMKIDRREYIIPPIYSRLSEIPKGGIGFVTGSGGDFCELQINGGRAGDYFSATIGEKVTFV